MSGIGLFVDDSAAPNEGPGSRRRPRAAVDESRRARSTERRAELLKAAISLFHEKGYTHTTMQDIADRMEFTKTAVYYYAKNKEELLLEIYAQIVEAAIAQARELAADKAKKTGADRFLAMIYNHLETFVANLEANAVFDIQRTSLSAATKAKMQALDREYHAILRAAYAAGIEDGSLTGSSPTVRVNAVVGMCNVTHRWYRPGGNMSASSVIAEILGIVESGVRTPGYEAG